MLLGLASRGTASTNGPSLGCGVELVLVEGAGLVEAWGGPFVVPLGEGAGDVVVVRVAP